jgi:hypothetical protein
MRSRGPWIRKVSGAMGATPPWDCRRRPPFGDGVRARRPSWDDRIAASRASRSRREALRGVSRETRRVRDPGLPRPGSPCLVHAGARRDADHIPSTERMRPLCAGSACRVRATAPRPDATAECRVAAVTLCGVTDRTDSRGTTREGGPLARRSIPHRDRRRLGFARIGHAPHTPRAATLSDRLQLRDRGRRRAPGGRCVGWPVSTVRVCARCDGPLPRRRSCGSRETRAVRKGVAGPASASARKRSARSRRCALRRIEDSTR